MYDTLYSGQYASQGRQTKGSARPTMQELSASETEVTVYESSRPLTDFGN